MQVSSVCSSVAFKLVIMRQSFHDLFNLAKQDDKPYFDGLRYFGIMEGKGEIFDFGFEQPKTSLPKIATHGKCLI